MENLYQVINNFNSIFGYSGKLVPRFTDQTHLFLQINYPILINDKKVKEQTEWNDGSISHDHDNNYGMCKIWLKQDNDDPKMRPKFILWYDNIYVNPFTMPYKNLADTFYASREKLFGGDANILVGKSEVFVSDKLIRQFMKICRQDIDHCKFFLYQASKIDIIQEYAQRIVDAARVFNLLELEMKFREQEKQHEREKSDE